MYRAFLTRKVAPSAHLLAHATTWLLMPALSIAQDQQAASEEPEQVIVTGSRIRGVEAVGSSTVSVGRDFLESTAAITTSDLMRNVPQVVNLGADETHRGVQGGQGNTTFASGVNLRGIGGNTTLLLFDGRRVSPQGSRGVYFDPSIIPTIALERVEVVPDGASAIYGSDAIAGVVNLIPRKHFVGVETNLQYGVADDYDKHLISALGGFEWDALGGGNIVVAVERSGHDALRGRDRDFYSSDLRSRGGNDFRTNMCNPGTIVVGGRNYAIPAGQDGTGLTPASFTADTTNLCDDAKLTDLIPEQRRTSALFYLSQNVGDSVELFAEGFHSDRDFEIHGILKNSVARAALTVRNTNPYFVSPVPGATSVVVNYRFPEEFGSSIQDGFDRTYQVTTGAIVQLPFDWKSTITAGYGSNKVLFRDNNLMNTAALNAALNSTDPATALNPFGDGASSPASVYDSFRSYSANNGSNIRRTGSFDADGPLFDLPGGSVRLALGYDRVDDRLTGHNRSTANTVTLSMQERTIDSVYGELFVPIVGNANAIPGFQRVDLSIAGRRDDYSDVGSTTNPKYGINWSPLDGLLLRASYGTSFRAPTLGDLVPTAQVFQRQLPDPTVPSGLSTGLLYSGGNPNLDPETATTRSFGFEFTPDALPGARLALNYFDIEYRDQALSLYGLANALLQNSYYARYIQRNPTPDEIATFLTGGTPNGAINPAVVTFLGFTQTQNLSVTIAKGFDLELGYQWNTAFGDFHAAAYGTRFTRYLTAPAADAPPVDVLNTINNPPKTRLRTDIGWSLGAWDVSTRFNYMGSYSNDLVAPAQKVDDFLTMDLHIAYRFSGNGVLDDLALALNVENAFDETPPFVNQIGGYDAQVANPLGRMVSLAVRKAW